MESKIKLDGFSANDRMRAAVDQKEIESKRKWQQRGMNDKRKTKFFQVCCRFPWNLYESCISVDKHELRKR